MEVRFTPEQEARIGQIATKAGAGPERQKGPAAECGEFIEEEMGARIKRMLRET